MRTPLIKFFSLTLLIGSFFLAPSAFAGPSLKVHLLENLSAEEGLLVRQSLKKMGYSPSARELFSEARDAIIITKILESEIEKPGLKIEVVHQESESTLPRTVFEYRTETSDLKAVLEAFPKPETLHSAPSMPMALQK
jgi:hypothetical protein